MIRNKIILGLLFIILGVFLFYWYEIRIVQIKHACSWVKHHSDPIAERRGKTEAQLWEEGKLKVCPTSIPILGDTTISFAERLENSEVDAFCEGDNRDVIYKNKPQNYVPAKNWYEKATDEEYRFCLRDKGF